MWQFCRAVTVWQPYKLVGDVDDDITAVALGPAFLPEIASHLGDLVDFLTKQGIII